MAGTAKGTEMALLARKALQGLDLMLDTEPAIFIDRDGRHWLNRQAGLFLGKRDVAAEELVEWVCSVGGYLQEVLYSGIRMDITSLPGGGLLVLLKPIAKASSEPALTQREKQVLVMLVRGLSNKEIARDLKVSPGTVNSHLDNIYRKLGCSGRLHACLIALTNGFAVLPGRHAAARPQSGQR